MQNITFEKISDSRIKVHISNSEEEWDTIKKSVIDHIASEKKIPGFRKGKIPEHIILSRFKEEFDHKFINGLISKVLPNVVPKTKIEIYKIIDAKNKGNHQFNFTYDSMPYADLCKLKLGELKEHEFIAEEKYVLARIDELKKNFAKTKPKDQKKDKILKGDMIDIAYEFWIDDVPQGKPSESKSIVLGEGQLNPNVEEYILKNNPSMNQEFEVKFKHSEASEDNNKEVEKDLLVIGKIKNLRSVQYPEINDEFAQMVDQKFKNLEELKQEIAESIKNYLRKNTLNKQIENLIKIYFENSKIHVSESYLMDKMINHLREHKTDINQLNDEQKKSIMGKIKEIVGSQIIYRDIIKKAIADLGINFSESFMEYVEEKYGSSSKEIIKKIIDKISQNKSLEDSESNLFNEMEREYRSDILLNYLKKIGIAKKGGKMGVSDYQDFLKQHSNHENERYGAANIKTQ